MNYNHEVEKLIGMMKEDANVPDYFTDIFRSAKLNPAGGKRKKVGIIGDDFYSLYVRGFGLDAVMLNGGSYYTGEVASHIFPQISDPVAKSAVGLLLDPELDLIKKLDAVVVAARNDSYKKAIAYLEEAGVKVIEVEPPAYVLKKMPLFH